LGLEDNFKRAVIQLVSDIPAIMEALNKHTLAMTELTEQHKRS